MGVARRSASRVAALLGVALLLSPTPALAIAPRTSLPAIEPQVMCVLCKIPLNVAQSQQANYERAFIQEQIDKGDTEAQVKKALVAQYGPLVLGLPAAHGFDLTVYIVPAIVVIALIVTLVALLPSWRRAARTAAGRARPGTGLSATDAARLESDLARFD